MLETELDCIGFSIIARVAGRRFLCFDFDYGGWRSGVGARALQAFIVLMDGWALDRESIHDCV